MTLPLILGIDPGLRNLGLARVRGRTVDRCTTMHTDAHTPLSVRLEELTEYVHGWATGAGAAWVQAIAYESQWQAQVGQHARGKSTHKSAQGLTVVGIIIGLARGLDLPLIELTPAEVKAGVMCSARADKIQVKSAVRALCTNVPKITSQHADDAIACAVAGGRRVPHAR